MKDLILIINTVLFTLIFLSYEFYEVILKTTEVELLYVGFALFLIFVLNVVLYIKGKKEIIKYELFFTTVTLSSFITKMFYKMKYYESQYYDIVYSNLWFEIKRHYNPMEYRAAMQDYIQLKYKSKIDLFTDQIRSELISKSKSIGDLYSNIDKCNYQFEQIQKPVIKVEIEPSVFEKMLSFCTDHPVLTITLMTGVIACIGIGYYNMHNINSAVLRLISGPSVQPTSGQEVKEAVMQLQEQISRLEIEGVIELQERLTRMELDHVAKLEVVVGQMINTIAELSGLCEIIDTRVQIAEGFYKDLLRNVLQNVGHTRMRVELIIRQLLKQLE